MEDKNGNSREISWRETSSQETGNRERSSQEMNGRESDENPGADQENSVHCKKPDTNHEICVLCGKPTGILRDRDISLRDCYVEGAGQLCRDCYFKVYGGSKRIGLQ